MSDKSKIEWLNPPGYKPATWNPVRGCDIISKGCTNCYAMKQAHRFSGIGGTYEGLTKLTKGGPVWVGKIKLIHELLDKPLRWKQPRCIFVNSMSDLFHDAVPIDFIDQVFSVMALTDQYIFQVLTKRPERMMDYLNETPVSHWAECAVNLWGGNDPDNVYDTIAHNTVLPLKNVWLGVSAEDQTTANERIPLLLQTPAAIRWVSAEPLLGPIDLTRLRPKGYTWLDCLENRAHAGPAVFEGQGKLDWVVTGGESGPGARPLDPDWIRELRNECIDADIPFFFKQWGEYTPYNSYKGKVNKSPKGKKQYGINYIKVGKKNAGRTLDNEKWSQYPI